MSRPIASTAHETPSLMPPLPPAAGAEGSNPIARYDSGFAAPLPRFRVTLPRLTPLLVSPSTRVDRRRRCEERLPRPLSSPGDRPPASQAAAAPATSEYRAPAPATGRKVVYKQGSRCDRASETISPSGRGGSSHSRVIPYGARDRFVRLAFDSAGRATLFHGCRSRAPARGCGPPASPAGGSSRRRSPRAARGRSGRRSCR